MSFWICGVYLFHSDSKAAAQCLLLKLAGHTLVENRAILAFSCPGIFPGPVEKTARRNHAMGLFGIFQSWAVKCRIEVVASYKGRRRRKEARASELGPLWGGS